MTEPIITLHVDPGSDVTEPLRAGLRQFNESRIGPYRRQTLVVAARDERGALLGGVQGVVLFGWLHVELLWVADEYRRQGLGGSLLERIERAASERGAKRVALLTTSWQAPEFYMNRGYEAVASFELDLDSFAEGGVARDYLLTKDLNASPR